MLKNSTAEDDDDEYYDDEDGSNEKYRRQLPSRDDPTVRIAEKEARKEARRLGKEAVAKKRQEKIPKHVKKRAIIKAGKKK